jgi:hypothetical protein
MLPAHLVQIFAKNSALSQSLFLPMSEDAALEQAPLFKEKN